MTKEQLKQDLRTVSPMILYLVGYLLWFYKIEQTPYEQCHLIQSSWDRFIPFNVHFIYFYFAWFIYVPYIGILLLNKDKVNYKRFAWLLMIGMTSFLLLNTFWPTCLDIRPATVPGNDLSAILMRFIHGLDPSTNVFPSMHVYVTLITWQAALLSDHPRLIHKHAFLSITAVLIIASTVFLKQHSIIDVIGGVALFAILSMIYSATHTERNTESLHNH